MTSSEESTLIPSANRDELRSVEQLIEIVGRLRALLPLRQVSSGLPAADLYRLIEELIEVLRFTVSAEHYRTAKDNPFIVFGREVVRTVEMHHSLERGKDGKIFQLSYPIVRYRKVPSIGELSLEQIRKLRAKRRVAVPVQAEIDELLEIQADLVSLRLNQSPSRRSPVSAIRPKKRSAASSRRKTKNKKRKKFLYPTLDLITKVDE